MAELRLGGMEDRDQRPLQRQMGGNHRAQALGKAVRPRGGGMVCAPLPDCGDGQLLGVGIGSDAQTTLERAADFAERIRAATARHLSGRATETRFRRNAGVDTGRGNRGADPVSVRNAPV